MSDREKVLQKLEKIKKLAEHGVGGEKDGAEKLLKKLMLQYKISENELLDDKKECSWFRYKNNTELQFLIEVIDMVIGECDFYGRKDKRKVVGIYCTKLEEIEIRTTFNFYLKFLLDDIKLFITAFCFRNGIFQNNPNEEINDLSLSEDEYKIAQMSYGIERRTQMKMLEDSSK